MEVNEAIAAAKSYVGHIYQDVEPISDISLEEVEFDSSKRHWLITVEFSRPVTGGFRTRARELIEAMGGDAAPRRRVQKVVVVLDDDRRGVALKNRSDT